MGTAIVGTIQLTALALVDSLPLSIGAGVFLSEYGSIRLCPAVRFFTDCSTSALHHSPASSPTP